MCLKQQHTFAISWLLLGTYTEKQESCELFYYDMSIPSHMEFQLCTVHLHTHACDWTPRWAFSPLCIMYENPHRLQPIHEPRGGSIHLLSPSAARVRGVELSLVTYFNY